MVRKSLKIVLQVALLVFSGWFGEWSYVVAAARSVIDWLVGGSAFPRIAGFTWFYGFTWRVAFYRGGIGPEDALDGLGFLLIPTVFWIFYEILKDLRLQTIAFCEIARRYRLPL